MSERGTVQDGRSGPEIQEFYVHRAGRQPARASAAIKARSRQLQQRRKHWAIVDLVGKGGHTFEPCLLPNGSKEPIKSSERNYPTPPKVFQSQLLRSPRRNALRFMSKKNTGTKIRT